jgi:hypothetical protein
MRFDFMRLRQLLGLLLVACGLAYAQSLPAGRSSTALAFDPQPSLALPSSVYVKVRIEKAVKVSALKPGEVVEGKLAQDVYSGDRELFAAGSRVRLIVDKLERRRRVPNDHWPWVVKALTPRHENYPTFQSATVPLPDGKEFALRVSLISIHRETEIRAEVRTTTKKKGDRPAANSTSQAEDASATQALLPGQSGSKDAESKSDGFANSGAIVTLEAANPREIPGAASGGSWGAASAGAVTLAAGTAAKIILLGEVSASKSRPGDLFQARLVEPVLVDSKVVLPEGTLLRGKVVKSTPPRVLSRSGSLLLAFTDLTFPGGNGVPAAASVTGAELDRQSHTTIDPEGKLHGDRPGKAWMLISAGVTTGIAKEADDATQLLVEALVETATDASTAGVAKIVGACASGVFMVTRHGRDVVLPRFTEMNITFDRPVFLDGSQLAPHAP